MEQIFNSLLWISALCFAGLACIGLILQKKPFTVVITGIFNIICGYFLLWIGAQVITAVTVPLANAFIASSGTKIMIASNEAAIAAALSKYALGSLLVLIWGCAINLLVARFTKYKAVFLTGHVLLFTSTLITALLSEQTGLPLYLIMIIGGTVLAGFNIASMAICQKYVDKVTANSGIALAHTGNISVFLAGILGTCFGNSKNSCEKLNIPKKVSLFRDASIASAITMSIVFIVFALVIGQAGGGLFGKYGPVVYGLVSGILFGIAVSVILFGLRLLTTDIVSTLKYTIEKLVPGAKLGLDSPMLMNYAPNSWLLGFLISYPLSLVFTYLMVGPLSMKYAVLLCSVPCFFDAGIAAVIGNAVGGKRGVVISSITHAIIASFGLMLLSQFVPSMQADSVIWGGPDAGVFGTVFGYILKLIGSI